MTSDEFPNDTVSESSWIPSSPPSTPSSCDEPVPLSSSSLGLARQMSTLYDDEELPAIVIDKKRRIEVHIAPECTNMNGAEVYRLSAEEYFKQIIDKGLKDKMSNFCLTRARVYTRA